MVKKKKLNKSRPAEKIIKWVSKKEKFESKRKRGREAQLDALPVDKTLPSTTPATTPLLDPRQLLQELMTSMRNGDADPLVREMAKYALGDVVGLGLMSQEQFDEPPQFDEEGMKIVASGREKALELIPVKVRAQVLCDITPYYLAKKSTTNLNGSGPKPKVTFYVPENGRPVRSDS